MSEFQFLTYGPNTWADGSRGVHSSKDNRPFINSMQINRDGSLMPRPGFREDQFITPTSALKPGKMARMSDDDGAGWLFVKGDGSAGDYSVLRKTSGVSTTIVEATTGLAGNNTAFSNHAPTELGVLMGSQHFQFDGTLATIVVDTADIHTVFGFTTALAPQSVTYVAVHQSRAFYIYKYYLAGSGVQTRVVYSDPYDFSSFSSASQFFELDTPPVGMVSSRSGLFFWDAEGKYYALQGRGDPEDATLTRWVTGRIPHPVRDLSGNALVEVNDVWYGLSAGDLTPIALSPRGVDEESLKHLHPGEDSLYVGAYGSARYGVAMLVYLTNARILKSITLRNGVWTNETLSDSIVPVAIEPGNIHIVIEDHPDFGEVPDSEGRIYLMMEIA